MCIYIYIYCNNKDNNNTIIIMIIIIIITIVKPAHETCHFCACRARRGTWQRLAKSSPYACPSAGAEVARLLKWHVWCLLDSCTPNPKSHIKIRRNRKQRNWPIGVWVKHCLKRRGCVCLVHLITSQCSVFRMLSQMSQIERFLGIDFGRTPNLKSHIEVHAIVCVCVCAC